MLEGVWVASELQFLEDVFNGFLQLLIAKKVLYKDVPFVAID